MAFIRRIFWFMRPRRKLPRHGYGKEVLYAGWVHAPRSAEKPRRSR